MTAKIHIRMCQLPTPPFPDSLTPRRVRLGRMRQSLMPLVRASLYPPCLITEVEDEFHHFNEVINILV